MPARAPTFSAFRHGNFRVLFAGYVVSLVGVWMQRVAPSWLVLEATWWRVRAGLRVARR